MNRYLLLSLVTVALTSRATPSSDQLVNHCKLLRELKSRLVASTIELPISQTITQTEAYLKRYESLIKAQWEHWLAVKDSSIQQLLEREKRFAPTHYVLYHAHNRDLIIFHDFLKEFYSYLDLENHPEHFVFMRSRELGQINHANANSYLDENADPNDCFDYVAAQMMAVNLSLYGNHFWPGECSFDYWISNRSARAPWIRSCFAGLWTHYNLPESYLDELMQLQSYLNEASGSLVQIMIPKDRLDDVAYLCHAFGSPYSDELLIEHFDKERNRHTALSPIIEKMITEPSSMPIEIFQARILFLAPLFDSRCGITMYRHIDLDPVKHAAYTKELQDIVGRVIAHIARTNTMPKGTALSKLKSMINAR